MEPERVPEPRFLTDVIVDLGFVSKERVQEAVESARTTNKTAEQILIDEGELTQEQLARALAERYGSEFVDLNSYPVDHNASRMVTRSVARRCRAVPVAFGHEDELVVAIGDSAGAAAAGDIAALTRMRVRPVVADPEQIAALIDQLPELQTKHSPRERRGGGEEAHPRVLGQGEHRSIPETQVGTPSQSPPPAPASPTGQAPAPVTASDAEPGTGSGLMDLVRRLADPSEEVDLSPDLKLVHDTTQQPTSSEQDVQALHAELAHLLDLDKDFRSTIEQVTEHLKRSGWVAGNERVAELEEQLRVSEQARAEAERERDELRQRLAAIRSTLAGDEPQ